MEVKQIDFSKTLSEDQIYNCILQNYEALGTDWVTHQWNWINGIYTPFHDHLKFLIIISLVSFRLGYPAVKYMDNNFPSSSNFLSILFIIN